MSIVKTFDVFCDVPGCLQWVRGATGAMGEPLTQQARRAARADGWVRRGAKDLCPEHAKRQGAT